MLIQVDYLTKDEEEVSALFFSTLEEAEEVKEFFDDSVELEIEEGFYQDDSGAELKGFFLFSRFQQEEEEQPDEATLQETGLIPVSFEEPPEE